MTQATPTTLLPDTLTSFIGRERELDEISTLLTTRATRLVTLTGAGGCGKTRLALALAQRLGPAFADGVWPVELAGLNSPDLVAQTVAAALGLPEARDLPVLEALSQYLKPKESLLLLDNCEHLLPACADLARALLEACPRLRLLATSREPLSLPAEIVWLVPSLTLPDAQSSTSLPVWLQSEAMQLFAARAQAALPTFSLMADNAATVARICRQLDGIPLAIELAAARVKMLDVEQIASRLDDGLQLLARGSRQSAPRHQTMRAALDWSYGLLHPPAQQLFCRLAVFAGGFTLEAAERVGADDSRQPPGSPSAGDVLDRLSDLVDKSMVWIAERPAHEPVRYRLLEPIRQYAQEKLRLSGAEAATRDRHLTYFVDFAEQAEPQLQTSHQRQWLRRLDQENDNLRLALAWSVQAADRNLPALRLSAALTRYWYQHGLAREGRQWLGRAIANYGAQPDGRTIQSERCLARALVGDGWLGEEQGDYGSIRAGLERALLLAHRLDDSLIEAQAAGLLGLLSGYRGDSPAVTRQLSEASVASARRSGDAWTLAWSRLLNGLRAYYDWSDTGVALAALEECEALFRQLGDHRWRAVVANMRGTIAGNSGDYATARALYEEAFDIAQELGDLELQYKETFNLAGLALVQGDLARAQDLFTRSLERARRRGAKMGTGESLQGLAHVHLLRGELDAADPLLRESLMLLRDVPHANVYARLLAKFARLAAARGQTEHAAQALGAIDAYAERHRVLIDVDEYLPVDQIRAWVRAAMAPPAFEAAHTDGRELTLEQAMQALLAAEPWSDGAAVEQAPAQTRPALRLYALGPMRVQGAAPMTWPYARVKELLFYLASQPPRSKAQIGLALWPEASSAQLRNSLGTTLYHLRRALGRPDWIVFEDDQYRFNRALGGQYDVDAFETGLAEAARLKERAPQQALPVLQAAVALYQGEFVEDLVEGEWFRLRREQLRRQYLNGLLDLGQLHFARGDYTTAAQTYRQAIEKENVLESAHRELMRCYERLGERGQALRHFQTLEQVMRAELGAPPAPESVALYEQLKRGEPV